MNERENNTRWGIALALVALAAVGLAAFGLTQFVRDQPPGDHSVDAGFARDMSYHHAQAVEMSSIVYRRTQDPQIQILAYDILITQQSQIGMMSGWLNVWELTAGSSDPPMAWMGHDMKGLMPGMATDEEVASLQTLPVEEMDRVFLQLMIRHHKGALDMAIAASERADVEFVQAIARNMAASQQAEVDNMERMLADRS